MVLKCPSCGYEYECKITEKGLEIIKGDKDFVEIDGNFTTKSQDSEQIERVFLFACPKCGSVKMVQFEY